MWPLYTFRWKLMGELARRGVGTLSLDSDVVLFYDPYPKLKGGELGKANLIALFEGL